MLPRYFNARRTRGEVGNLTLVHLPCLKGPGLTAQEQFPYPPKDMYMPWDPRGWVLGPVLSS